MAFPQVGCVYKLAMNAQACLETATAAQWMGFCNSMLNPQADLVCDYAWVVSLLHHCCW